MTEYVDRTCHEVSIDASADLQKPQSYEIEKWQDSSAYILLAPPGSGKTTIFKQTAERQGGDYVTARDFITLDLETVNSPIFIDGLDEQRAGQNDGRTSLDAIRTKLYGLDKPKFRLSCREADWLGSNDTENIKKVSPDGEVKILQLDPLKPEDIRQILKSDKFNISNPDQFISKAEDNGLYDLLINPQSLKMLALSVASNNNWPSKRKEVFELACKSLLKEHNSEHLIATKSNRGNINDLMDDCDHLCAIYLLTGLEGFADNSELNHIILNEIPGIQQASIEYCLQSKLFSSPSLGTYIPTHRQIAEYLAGRYLSKLVNEGLPPSRILALITGFDGRVVSELRGLSAWFASHNKPGRGEIFTRDPLGTVLYGDVIHFSKEEKIKLLESLNEEAEIFPSLIQAMKLDARIGDLITPDMESEIGKILNSISYSNTDQTFLYVLLEALRQGKPIKGITDKLVKLIWGEEWWERIRLLAIDVLVKYQKGNLVKLREICGEIHSGKINDPQDSLLGHILSILYPAEISELEILKYLKVPRESFGLGAYEYFWRYQLPDKSNHKQLGSILDQLADRYYELPLDTRSKGIARFGPRCYVTIILYRFLQKSENDFDLDKLFKWLGITHKANSGHALKRSDFSLKLHQWLNDHPDIWKSLFSRSVTECSKKSETYNELVHCLFQEKRGRLFDFVPPTDFCDWCLDEALNTEGIVAEWYITQVADNFHKERSNGNPTLKTISNALENRDDLDKIFNQRIELLNKQQSAEINSELPNRGLQQRPNWHNKVKPYENEIRNNTVNPVILSNLARVYFAEFDGIGGNSPRERLEYVLDRDHNLVEAVLASFSDSLLRNDLPEFSEIIKLDSQDTRHPLSLPLLAGFEEKSKEGQSFLTRLEGKYLRLGVAVHFTSLLEDKYIQEQQNPPSWYNWILINHPRIVADVLVEYASTTLKSKTRIPENLYDLSFSEEYEEVAKYAAFRILKRFPVRCKSHQLTELGYLFFAARQHNSQDLNDLVYKKLMHKSMNIEQRIHWLALGLCMNPEFFVKKLDEEISRSERRIRYFANTIEKKFFYFKPGLEVNSRVEVIKQIIKHLGGLFWPYKIIPGKPVWVTKEMTFADKVKDYINQLSNIPSEKATQTLSELASDNQLLGWKNYLEYVYQNHVVSRREADFEYSNLDKVLQTLENKEPSNPADLAALTFNYLDEIREKVHDSNTTDWKQYWNVDKYGRPENPRPEDTCRDNLLSDLKPKLQRYDIEAQPEGTYVNDKRSDIRISCSGFNVPIEIKRSCHRDLWTSIQSQLITKYTRDPNSKGHGIYVVFWFGHSKSCKPQISPKGTKPSGPDEIREQLINSLTLEQRNKIKVCVLDVSNQMIS